MGERKEMTLLDHITEGYSHHRSPSLFSLPSDIVCFTVSRTRFSASISPSLGGLHIDDRGSGCAVRQRRIQRDKTHVVMRSRQVDSPVYQRHSLSDLITPGSEG